MHAQVGVPDNDDGGEDDNNGDDDVDDVHTEEEHNLMVSSSPFLMACLALTTTTSPSTQCSREGVQEWERRDRAGKTPLLPPMISRLFVSTTPRSLPACSLLQDSPVDSMNLASSSSFSSNSTFFSLSSLWSINPSTRLALSSRFFRRR